MQEVDVSKCIFKRGANTYFNLKEVLHEKSNHSNLQKNVRRSTSKSRGVHFSLFFFSLSLNLAGSERIILITFFLVSWVMFFTPERLVEISVLGLFLFAMM